MNKYITHVQSIASATFLLLLPLLLITTADAGIVPAHSTTSVPGGTLPPAQFTTGNWSSNVHFAVYEYSPGDPIAGESGFQNFAPPADITVCSVILPPDCTVIDSTDSIMVNEGEYLYVYQIDHDDNALANISSLIVGILVPALDTITSLGYTNDGDVSIFGLGSGDTEVPPLTDGPTKANFDTDGQAAIYTFSPFGVIEAGDESFTLFFTSTAPPKMHAASLYGGGADTQFIPSPDNDFDEDGVYDDGDFSGVSGDTPCTGGNTSGCDDNCIDIANPNQEDMDYDGYGDVCDTTIFDDFDDGNDLGWTPVSGDWAVINGEYSGYTGDFGNPLAVSIIAPSVMSGNAVIEVNIMRQPVQPSVFKSAFIIFDYQDINDYKYVHANLGDRRWEIGHRINGIRMSTIIEDGTINSSLPYRLRVFIAGNNVSLYVDDGAGMVYKMSHVFSSMGSGSFGLGSLLSHFHFDDFFVDTGYQFTHSDDFNDGGDEGWVPKIGSWTVVNGKYSGYTDSLVTLAAISVIEYSETVDNSVIELDVTSQSVQPSVFKSAFIIFDYLGPNDYKYVHANLGDKWWEIGHRYNGYRDSNILDDITINPFIPYRLRAVISGKTVSLYVDDGGGFVYKVSKTFMSMGLGEIGLGTFLSHFHFDNLTIN